MMLEVRALHKSFRGPVHALRNVSFSMARGEALGVVGESGSGKTTLAKLVMRLITPDSGGICFDGKGMQIVFQNPNASFDPRLTIGASLCEALSLGLVKNRTKIKERAASLLGSAELPSEFAKRFPHELSGGECQRAAIARALSRDPELLICDEPVSSLDLLAQAKILNLFLKLRQERGISLFFVSHDLRVIRHLCDRVLVMKNGEIRETGTISQVFENPRDPYTRELLLSSGII
jgi:peptide/nickel transport system ATP-binding protein